MKALGYKVPQSVVRPNEYHFIHPETGVVDIIAKSTGSRTSTIVGVENWRNSDLYSSWSVFVMSAAADPVVSVLMHLELSSPRMKEDLLVM